jgi:hypothetical protein
MNFDLQVPLGSPRTQGIRLWRYSNSAAGNSRNYRFTGYVLIGQGYLRVESFPLILLLPDQPVNSTQFPLA